MVWFVLSCLSLAERLQLDGKASMPSADSCRQQEIDSNQHRLRGCCHVTSVVILLSKCQQDCQAREFVFDGVVQSRSACERIISAQANHDGTTDYTEQNSIVVYTIQFYADRANLRRCSIPPLHLQNSCSTLPPLYKTEI